MRHRAGPRKTRYPGVYQLGERFLIRWTRQVQGRRKDFEQLLPEGTTLEQAVTARSSRVQEAKAPPPEPEQPSGPPTVGAYVRSWLRRKLPGMKPSTAEVYVQSLGDHVLPALVDEEGEVTLGDHRLDRVTRAEVERWVLWAERQTRPATRAPDSPRVPCARATLLGWWSKVRQVLKDAAAEYQLPDPTARVQGPRAYEREPVKEQRTLTPSELLALFDHVSESWHAEIYTAAVLGCRAGELYELRWTDVDFERRTITIQRSHHKGRVGTTKTRKKREDPIPDELLGVLKAHRARQMREQHPALSTGLVFPMSEDGQHFDDEGRLVEDRAWHRGSSSARGQLRRASRAANLPIIATPQVLRRTANTLLVDAGVDRLVIRAIMGHSSEAMTAHYYGAKPAEKMAAVTRLEDIVRKG